MVDEDKFLALIKEWRSQKPSMHPGGDAAEEQAQSCADQLEEMLAKPTEEFLKERFIKELDEIIEQTDNLLEYDDPVIQALEEGHSGYRKAISILQETWDNWRATQTDEALIQKVWESWIFKLHDTIRGEM